MWGYIIPEDELSLRNTGRGLPIVALKHRKCSPLVFVIQMSNPANQKHALEVSQLAFKFVCVCVFQLWNSYAPSKADQHMLRKAETSWGLNNLI